MANEQTVQRCGGEGSGWLTAVLLFFTGWAVIYANRTVLSPLLQVLGVSWELSLAQLGLLNSLFFLAYSLLQIPSGVLADRFGRKTLLVGGYWVHGVGALLSGLAPGFGLMLGARTLTGLGQGPYYSSQFALASEVLPAERKSFGLAFINTGMAVGTAFGWALSGLLVYGLGLGWRWPILLLSGLTLMVALLLGAKVQVPGPADGAGSERVSQPRASFQWRPLLRTRALLAYVAMFCSMYGFFVFLTWLPYYLQVERGISGGTAGALAALMPLAAVPGGLLVGRLADLTGRRRPLLLILFPLSAVAIWTLAAFPTTLGLVVGIALYGISGKLSGEALLVRLVGDWTEGGKGLATVFGALNFAGTLAMVAAPWLTGWLADRTQDFSSGFLMAAALQVVGFVAILGLKEEGP